ncbi:MAG: hypothetical protein ACHQ4F_15700 [Candidatus Dormibacteria bacterium]
MTITDNRSTIPAPAAAPPPVPASYVRRHPILAAFGVLSGLSLFSALGPVSAVVVAVAVAGHATGLDRTALRVVERLATRISVSAHHRDHREPAPAPTAPTTPEPAAPAPAPSAPRRETHTPSAPSAPLRRGPHARTSAAQRPVRTRRPATPERHAGSRMDGPGL